VFVASHDDIGLTARNGLLVAPGGSGDLGSGQPPGQDSPEHLTEAQVMGFTKNMKAGSLTRTPSVPSKST
jgi:hypothetical protein